MKTEVLGEEGKVPEKTGTDEARELSPERMREIPGGKPTDTNPEGKPRTDTNPEGKPRTDMNPEGKRRTDTKSDEPTDMRLTGTIVDEIKTEKSGTVEGRNALTKMKIRDVIKGDTEVSEYLLPCIVLVVDFLFLSDSHM